MSERGWFDQEAIDSERMDADIEQADLEAAGRDYGRRQRKMRVLLAAGKLAEAAAACPHGGGYPLRSIAAKNTEDPRAGQDGVRCDDCGSVLDEWGGNLFQGAQSVVVTRALWSFGNEGPPASRREVLELREVRDIRQGGLRVLRTAGVPEPMPPEGFREPVPRVSSDGVDPWPVRVLLPVCPGVGPGGDQEHSPLHKGGRGAGSVVWRWPMNADGSIRYDLLPDYMREPVRRWIEKGDVPGHFLQAVIKNDLMDAVARADDENIRLLPFWVKWFYNEAPGGCWGSKTRLDAWAKKGGLHG